MAFGRSKPTIDPRKPGAIEAALRRSLRAAVVGDWPKAETWLERIVEADTSDLDAYHALARLYRAQGAVDRAIRMHQNLLMRQDLDARGKREALLELARDFDAGGFAARAAATYEEVLDATPRLPEALERLVHLLGEMREFERALALVKRWRRFDREGADEAERTLLLASAQASQDVGDSDAARGLLKRALKRDANFAPAHRLMGDLEAERGKDARAITSWRKAIEAAPQLGPELYPKIEAGFSARGKSADYEKLLRKHEADRPGDAACQIALARLLASRGESTAAIECLARATEVAPNESTLHVELGRRLLDEGNESEALKAYRGLLDALEEGRLKASADEESGA